MSLYQPNIEKVDVDAYEPSTANAKKYRESMAQTSTDKPFPVWLIVLDTPAKLSGHSPALLQNRFTRNTPQAFFPCCCFSKMTPTDLISPPLSFSSSILFVCGPYNRQDSLLHHTHSSPAPFLSRRPLFYLRTSLFRIRRQRIHSLPYRTSCENHPHFLINNIDIHHTKRMRSSNRPLLQGHIYLSAYSSLQQGPNTTSAVDLTPDSAELQVSHHDNPCVRICRYNQDFYQGKVCLGCFRELYEIATWTEMSQEDKEWARMDIQERKQQFQQLGL